MAKNTQSVEEMKKTLAEKQTALRTFRFNVSGSKTTNVKEARNLRKEIARLLTDLNGSTNAHHK